MKRSRRFWLVLARVAVAVAVARGLAFDGSGWTGEQCKPRVEKTPGDRSGRQDRQRYNAFGGILILEKFTFCRAADTHRELQLCIIPKVRA